MKLRLLLVSCFSLLLTSFSTLAHEKPIALKSVKLDAKTTQVLQSFNFIHFDENFNFIIEIDGITSINYYKASNKSENDRIEFLFSQNEIIAKNIKILPKWIKIETTDPKHYKIKSIAKGKNLHYNVSSPKGKNFFEAWPAKWTIILENVTIEDKVMKK